MDAIWFPIIVILLLTLANGVFSGSEIAVVSSRRGRLQQRAEAGSRGAQRALDLAEDPNRFLSTVQVGITLIGTFAGAYGGDVLADPLATAIAPYVGAATAQSVALTLVVVVITYLSLILGELVPKRLALQNAEALATLVAPSMYMLSRIAAPVVWFLSFSTQMVLRLLGRAKAEEEQVTEEDILSLVREGRQHGALEASEQALIERVFDFGDVAVRQVMTSRVEMVSIALDMPLPEVVRKVLDSGYSRIPVYDNTPNNVVGILFAKDLLHLTRQDGEAAVSPQLADLLRPPIYVLEHQRIATVLTEFKQQRMHLALVLDEYGQIEGLVSMEDVLEQLTGDIGDEHDEANTMVVARPDGSWLVDGLLSYADAQERVGLPSRETLEELADFETVAGLVLAVLQHIPATGESTTWRDWQIEVVDMDGVRIDKVLIRRVEGPDSLAQNEAMLAFGAASPPTMPPATQAAAGTDAAPARHS